MAAASTKSAGGYQPSSADREVIDPIMRRYEESKQAHQSFVRRYEKNERSYRGILERAAPAASWRHQMHPPYAFNLLETVVANTVEMGIRFNAKPSPKGYMSLDEAMATLKMCDTVQDLLRHEHRVDDFDRKQRPLYLTAGIGGRGILKNYWRYEEGPVRQQQYVDREVEDEFGNVLTVPMIERVETMKILHDHSTTEVVDPRDFWTHESARALQPLEPGGAQYLFHRCWYSWEQMKMLEASGWFKNVEYLGERRNDSPQEYDTRESEVFQIEPHKDLIEVLEYWCFKDGAVMRTIVSGNGVLLREEEANPFDHGEYPFSICSSMPLPFTTIGMSQIELIAHLQEMLWELMNQRLDNVELLNNFITLIRMDVEDSQAFPFYPGAQWPVEDKDAVTPLLPPYQLADLTLHAEAQIKGDLQNVTSAAPFAGGAETQTVEQKTATGASIVMNAAQLMMQARKYNAQQGLLDEAYQRVKNCQQFLTDKRVAHILTKDGTDAWREIDPVEIQGEFLFELEALGESQMREQRRAEGTQFLQVVAGLAPLFAASGTPLNLQELGKWFFEEWGIEGGERFFTVQPPPPMMAAAQGGGAQGAPLGAAPGGPNLGVTSETAVDASKPSATGGLSMSPEVFAQRAAALGGGGGGY